MFIIGLTGSTGSGTSTIADLFAQKGHPVFSCDKVYHDMISYDGTLTKELVATFGEEIHDPKGGIDRCALRKIAFADPETKQKLEAITHPHIFAALDEWLKRAEKQGIPVVVIDAPLLIETNLYKRCNLNIVVWAPKSVRLMRIVARDNITQEEAEARVNAQIRSDREKVLLTGLELENSNDILHTIYRFYHLYYDLIVRQIKAYQDAEKEMELLRQRFGTKS